MSIKSLHFWVALFIILCVLLLIISVGSIKANELFETPFPITPVLLLEGELFSNAGEPNVFPSPPFNPYPFDMQAIGDTSRISVDYNGLQSVGHSSNGYISGDGSVIAYDSKATNLVVNDTNGKDDVFLFNIITHQTTRISLTYQGFQANGNSTYPSLSLNGRYVSFRSDATDLVTGDTNNLIDIFFRDNQLGLVQRVSVATDGTQANGNSLYSVVSADGIYTSFHSDASNLVSGDTNNVTDVFVHDMITNQTIRISVSSADGQGNLESRFPSISNDGHYVVKCLVLTSSAL